MASEKVIVLPGDAIDHATLPQSKKHPLRLGPGLRYIPPGDLAPQVAGQLRADHVKNTVWVEKTSGRYVPSAGDRVIGTIHRSMGEQYHVLLADSSPPAMLPHMSFESASRKNRPNLAQGSLVYARVALADKHMDPELECVSSTSGKSDGLGPLGPGGMLFRVSLGMARRLLMPKPAVDGGLVVLDELEREGLAFETVVGRNGRVWVDCGEGEGRLVAAVVVGRALVETDEEMLGVEAQKKLVRKLVKMLKKS